MAWIDIPERLRQRWSASEVAVALVTLVTTPLFGLLWVVGPYALAAVLIARDQRLLAAAAITGAMLWTVVLVREGWQVIGLVFAWPAAAWSLLQRVRGRVHVDELEEGRFVDVRHRAPTAAERERLEAFAATAPEIAEQVARAEVIGECVCDCGSLRLLARAPGLDGELRLELEGYMLRTHLGWLRALDAPGCRRLPLS